MLRWLIKIFGVVFILLGLCAFGLWLVLQSDMLNPWRAAILEKALSEHFEHPIVVSGDVTVDVGTQTRIRVGGVEIPSENIDGFELAHLDVLEFDVETFALIKGGFILDKIDASGLKVHLLRTQDNKTSWSSSTKDDTNAQSDASGTNIPLLDILKRKTASFTNMQLLVQNETNGFEFDFVLNSLTFEQFEQDQLLAVRASGLVNGQVFETSGNFPKAAPFETSATFGAATVQFNGEPVTDSAGGGYIGDFDLVAPDLADLTEVLRLGRPFEGKGRLSVSVTRQRNVLALSDILLVVDGADGKQLKTEGTIANLFTRDGFDLLVDTRLHSNEQLPTQAARFSDVKLTGISTRITSVTGKFEVEDMLIRTNLFDRGLDEIGPIRLGEIRRTEENKLAIADFSVQAGPVDIPFIVAEGRILDLLSLKEFDVTGEILAPASLFLGKLGADVEQSFGAIRAGFAVDDQSSVFRIRAFDARTEDASVWSMQSRLVLGDASTMRGLEFDLSLGIPDGDLFMEALGLEPAHAEDFMLTTSARTTDNTLVTDIGLAVGASKLTTHLTAKTVEARTVFDALIHSKELKLEDLRKAVASVVEIVKFAKAPPKRNVQPLVLPRNVQPLVLDKTDVKLTEVIDFDQILLKTDVDAKIEIEKIVGLAGISKVSSTMTLNKGKADLGPLDIRYGGGHLSAHAKMDLHNTPDLLSITGSTGGWNLGRILQSVGVSMGADGILNGRFNLTGNRSSGKTFANTMRGSASINMSKGTLDTSLIELAGLGIFPWLFSEELRQKKTSINCLSAPLRITAGRVDFTSAVAETNRVQLVARGSLDWVRDSIAVRAEPRPVGRPLSRSAWPFEINGKLSAPQFNLIKGGSRSRRVDGADQMPATREPCKPDIIQLQ